MIVSGMEYSFDSIYINQPYCMASSCSKTEFDIFYEQIIHAFYNGTLHTTDGRNYTCVASATDALTMNNNPSNIGPPQLTPLAVVVVHVVRMVAAMVTFWYKK